MGVHPNHSTQIFKSLGFCFSSDFVKILDNFSLNGLSTPHSFPTPKKIMLYHLILINVISFAVFTKFLNSLPASTVFIQTGQILLFL